MEKNILLLLCAINFLCEASNNTQESENDLTADGVFDMVVVQTMQNCNQFGNYTASNQQAFTQASTDINRLLGYACVANGSCQNPQTTSDTAVSCDSPYNDASTACQQCLQQFISADCSLYNDTQFLLLPIGFKNAIAAKCGNGLGSWFCKATNNPTAYTLGCFYGLSLFNVSGHETFKPAIDAMYYNYLNDVQQYITAQLQQGNLDGAQQYIQQDFTPLYSTLRNDNLVQYASNNNEVTYCFNDSALQNVTTYFQKNIINGFSSLSLPLCSALKNQGYAINTGLLSVVNQFPIFNEYNNGALYSVNKIIGSLFDNGKFVASQNVPPMQGDIVNLSSLINSAPNNNASKYIQTPSTTWNAGYLNASCSSLCNNNGWNYSNGEKIWGSPTYYGSTSWNCYSTGCWCICDDTVYTPPFVGRLAQNSWFTYQTGFSQATAQCMQTSTSATIQSCFNNLSGALGGDFSMAIQELAGYQLF